MSSALKYVMAGRRVVSMTPMNSGQISSWSDAGQRILVVDDLDMRNLSDALVQGLQVMTANHGKRGFELAMDHTPELIVTDWMMPVMSGPELIQTIHSEPHSEQRHRLAHG